MFYNITMGGPSKDGFHGYPLQIEVWPQWRELVAASEISQAMANKAVESMGRHWLDSSGYDAIYDPDENPLDMWKEKHMGEPKKYGPDARPLYTPNMDLRVSWGEWGIEHINVPGDACGLDIDRAAIGAPRGGVTLYPHNMDSMNQAFLCLRVWTWFADAIITAHKVKEFKK